MPENPHEYWTFESLLAFFDSSLSGSQTSDGHTEGAAGHIVQADLVAELDGHGVAAVLAADTVVQILAGSLCLGDSHLHQHANAGLIQLSKGIVLEDLGIIVSVQELACVVTGEAEGHLSQVVGAEAEELNFLRDLLSGQTCSSTLAQETVLCVIRFF